MSDSPRYTPDISPLLRTWQLSEPELLAETKTSFIYRVKLHGEIVVLKVFNALGAADEKNGANALRHFAGHAAVKVYAQHDNAVLLEYASGPSLVTLVKQGQDLQATQIIADTLTLLHSPVPSFPVSAFTPLSTWFQSLFLRAQASHDGFFRQAAAVAQSLLQQPQNVGVLHGDMHHDNIIGSPRGWLAIDPKGLYGERTYDAANALLNPHDMDDLVINEKRLVTNAEILANALGVERQRLLQFTFAYCGLSAAWSLEDKQNPDLAIKVGKLLQPYVG